MIKDALTDLVDNLPATASGALGNVIDLKKSGIDIGAGQPVYAVVTASTAVSGGPANLILATSDNEDMSDPTNVLTVPVTDGEAGSVYAAVSLPVGDYKRYLGVVMEAGLSSGNLNVSLVLDVPNMKTYEKA